ncbi:glycosyltransferase family 39 protein [Sphaerimonospora cavernae]|uniref:Glycosyltransferase family 39 protein n=1 Tax=Sphaerimonospora cavernae TaxID=1740611 RepID=A0ABV6U9G6_9ACTN
MRRPYAIAAPAGLALVAGLWDLASPPVWRDEAATLSAVIRTPHQLLHLLQAVDAVHGLYYALMHVVVALFGTGEVVLRLPSVVAGALAAAGVGALGRALGHRRAGLYGGMLMATMPIFSRYVQEARPYPLAMAATIGVTLLLLRAVRGPSAAAFTLYGVALAALGYVNLFAFLVAGVHGVYVALSRGPVWRWCGAAAGALAVVGPLVWLASRQTAQIGWIPRPGPAETGMLAVELFGDVGAAHPAWLGVAPLAWALALLGVALCVRTSGGRDLLALTLPWLLVPPLVLLAVSWAAHPVYVFRYVFCCLPAAALLVGAGLAVLPSALSHALVRRAAVAVLAVAWLGLSIPGQLDARGPDGRQDDPRPVMALLASAARPGDGVLFAPGKARKYAVVYPGVFERLDDVALARSPESDGSFRGREAGRRVLADRLAGLRTIWVVGHAGKAALSSRRFDLLRRSFVPTGRWTFRGMFVARYSAGGSPGSSPGPNRPLS